MSDLWARPFQPGDQAACLAVFDSNLPKFFAPTERADFQAFLCDKVMTRPYLVIQRAGRLIGCGGLQIDGDGRSAFLSWGMIAQDCHGTGAGQFLTKARLAMAAKIPGLEKLTLNTSQHTKGFYERFGFAAQKLTPDGYGPGLDRWVMELLLT